MAGTYLQTLISRFPDLALSITRLNREDAEFRSICEEMEMAEAAHGRWQHMPDRADEYARIFDRLQKEFLHCLSRENRAALVREMKRRENDNGRNT